MIRLMLLFSPALVLLIWAGFIAVLGRTDTSVALWLLALAGSIVLHTWQEYQDFRSRR